MVKGVAVILACSLAVISALPANDPVISKWDPEGLRFSYMEDDEGKAHLVDNWMKISDLSENARYDPDRTNVYHLFTRANPWVSQPLILNDANRVSNSNYDSSKRTVVLMHGFAGSVTSGFNTVLVPAYLAADDCNVLVLDWSSGSFWGPRAIEAGQAGGRFINWLNSVTGSQPGQYTVAGYSVGGHGAGIIARTVQGDVAYVIGLDPAERWDNNWLFSPNDGIYTEVIHTSDLGEVLPMGQVDFYPNGGRNMPGCITDLCDHYRSYYYLGESVQRGGFTGTRCLNLQQAVAGNCNQPGTLQMGGLTPKNGNTGIFHLRTNFLAPFSQG